MGAGSGEALWKQGAAGAGAGKAGERVPAGRAPAAPRAGTEAAAACRTAVPPPQVHRPRGLRLAAMRAVGVVMLLVAAGATVGAVYTMIHSFQTMEFFQ